MTDRDGGGGPPTRPGMLRRLSARSMAILAVAAAAIAAVPAFGLGIDGAVAAVVAALVVAAWPSAAGITLSANTGSARPRSIWPDAGMRVTLQAIGDPCFVADPDGVLRFQNRAATARFGKARPGDPLSFKLRVPDLLAAVEAAGRGGRPTPVRFTERAPTERVYLATIVPIRLDAREAGTGARADFVLVRLGDETEQARLERTRSDFVANASHELRTPLASLTGFIETLLGPARDDAVNRERFLKIMLEQAHRMARLIDDLLSLSRIEMKAPVAPTGSADLKDVAAHVAGTLGSLADKAGVTLTLSLPVEIATVPGDRDELIQVAANLVENAIKYGREGGRVTVTVADDRMPDGAPGRALRVADDGPGIAEEHLPRLTERFYRVDADQSRRQKGTGLGLAIVKHIVARHRGRLAIHSTVGAGTTVTVLLPAAPADGGHGSAEAPGEASEDAA